MVASSSNVLKTVIAAGFDVNKPDKVGNHLQCNMCAYNYAGCPQKNTALLKLFSFRLIQVFWAVVG